MKILLIEDEPKTLSFIKKGLEENGYDVSTAMDGITGKQLALAGSHDLVISDIVLPGLDGKALCKQLRELNFNTPLLMLTALGGVGHVVEGLDSGADDYLVKPFEFQELLARIRTLTKRKEKEQSADNILRIGNLEMNLVTRNVNRGGVPIQLTAKEYALLEYFLRHKEKVLSRQEIVRNVWGLDFDTGTNVVEVYVNYLRRKVDKDYDTKLIHTQFGMGYIMRQPK
ncbi:MAG: response regulator transcription factor [Cyclobacteriaceae bacterium]|nr:response regulator transcription factor [Cyclobacteriaceae bacterium]